MGVAVAVKTTIADNDLSEVIQTLILDEVMF